MKTRKYILQVEEKLYGLECIRQNNEIRKKHIMKTKNNVQIYSQNKIIT